MMKEVILPLTVLVMFIVCFFVMGKIGYFINEILQDKIENIFNDINHAIFNDDYQKKCGKAGMIIYDSKKEDKRQCFDGDKTV